MARERRLFALAKASSMFLAVSMFVGACSGAVAPSSATSPPSSTGATPSVAANPTTNASPTTAAAPTTTTPDPLLGRTEAEIDVPGGPDLPVEAFGSIWLLTPDGDVPAVTRIDPTTNEIAATVANDSRLCQALGATETAIWVCTGDGVAAIDPLTNEIGPAVEFDQPASPFFGYLPYGAGSLWALGGEGLARNQVVRVDTSANAVSDTYEIGFGASWLSFGEGALWITDTIGGALWRLDPGSGELTEHASNLPGPGPIAVGAGSIWLAVRTGPDDRPTAEDVTVVRINPVSGDVEAEIIVGGTMGEVGLDADDDSVWIRAIDPFLALVDPETSSVVESFDAPRLGGSVIEAFDSVWTTSYRMNRVWRLAPQ